jgi:hypothetical protein
MELWCFVDASYRSDDIDVGESVTDRKHGH